MTAFSVPLEPAAGSARGQEEPFQNATLNGREGSRAVNLNQGEPGPSASLFGSHAREAPRDQPTCDAVALPSVIVGQLLAFVNAYAAN